jgi:NAD(P)H-hydrate epimerase
MNTITLHDVQHIVLPSSSSHKGQNGRMLLIGGSSLFHAASLWSLTVASRIVDLVHYCSTDENNEIVRQAKSEFRNGIVIPRSDVESYIEEDDTILIGPGMVRSGEEGEYTKELTNYLLKKYEKKQWIIDAGALQMMNLSNIPYGAILTPHRKEFDVLWEKVEKNKAFPVLRNAHISLEEKIIWIATTYTCIVLVKGPEDIVCDGRVGKPSKNEVVIKQITGGNGGMTKGGTGDVLAGLIASLATKNDPFLATVAGSFFNKQAGDDLYKIVGPFFNASDLADQIPKTMKRLLL